MNMNIGVIKGDGIGPEIVDEAMKVLDQVAKVYGHTISYTQLLMGGASIDVAGVPLTEATLAAAKASDAVLMGSIGGDAKTSPWYQLEPSRRPEAGLLQLRKGLNLFANLRPAVLYEELKGACPLKEEIADRGFDLMIMRELTGGLYFGKRSTEEIDGVVTAKDELTYNENEIRRIARRGFDIAMKRRKKVTSVDKANVLDSSRLWRKIVEEVAADYPEVELEHMLVDNCAMQLVKDPAQFDVILTENMFGDILSDEASMVTGSIGMLASASLNDTKFGLYEPSGGSAPDIAGKGIANPIATILSAAMMLRYSFDLDKDMYEKIDQKCKRLRPGCADAGTEPVSAALPEHYIQHPICLDGWILYAAGCVYPDAGAVSGSSLTCAVDPLPEPGKEVPADIRISFYNQQHRHHDGGRVATVLCFAACGRFLHLHRCDPSVP